MFGLFNRYTYIEVKSIRGRADIVMFAENTVYVLEFKVDSSAEEALQQIVEQIAQQAQVPVEEVQQQIIQAVQQVVPQEQQKRDLQVKGTYK